MTRLRIRPTKGTPARRRDLRVSPPLNWASATTALRLRPGSRARRSKTSSSRASEGVFFG